MNPALRDLIGGAAFIAVGAAGLLGLGDLPFGSSRLPGPAMLPTALSVLIIVLAAVHVVRAVRDGAPVTAPAAAPTLGRAVGVRRAALLRVAGAVVIIAAWVFAARPLGYPAATALAMSGLYALGGGGPVRALLAGMVLMLATWLLFGVLLGVPLPSASLLD